MYECVTPGHGARKWIIWVSDKIADHALICKTGGMIGVNRKKVRELQQVTTKLVEIWDSKPGEDND